MQNELSAAICIVGYNRIDGIERLLSSLERANYHGRKDVALIFSIDNSGTDTVEKFAEKYTWQHGEKIIRTFDKRQGLKAHILQCGDYTETYDVVIILEDDIMVSECFFDYAVQAAKFYWNDDNIAGISLYTFQKNWLDWELRFEPQTSKYDSFFLRVAQSWGEVWTKPKWTKFKKWYAENSVFTPSDKLPAALMRWQESSWLKFHDRYCIEQNKYFVYPYTALSTNSSLAGEHADAATGEFQVNLQCEKDAYTFPVFSDDAVIYDEFMNRKGLGKYLNVSENDLTADLWRTKNVSLTKRYLLTTDILDYKVIASFALALRPIELNVIYSVSGEGIYLYDTLTACKNKRKAVHNKNDLLAYTVRSLTSKRFNRYSRYLFKRRCISLARKLKKRILQ